jgi:type IV pilus assembly protein PilM
MKNKIFQYLKKSLTGEPYAIGLDIGTRYIKVAQIKKKSGKYILEKYGVIKLLPEIIVDREIMDREVLVESFKNLIKETGLDKKNISIIVSGKNVIIKKVSIKSPKPREINDTIQKLAVENIPFNLKEVVMDSKRLQDKQGQFELLLAAVKNESVYPWIDVLKESGLNPVNIDIAPIVLQAIYKANDYVKKEGTYLIINVGFEHTLITIVKDNFYLMDDEIPLGVRSFVEELQRVCGIRAEEASRVIRGEKIENVNEELASGTINSTAKRLLNRIERVLPEISEWNGIIIGGGGTTIKEIKEVFTEHFKIECEIGNPLKTIECATTPPEVPTAFDIAIGLAISKLEKVNINLLPLEERAVEKNKLKDFLRTGFLIYIPLVAVLILGLIGLGLSRKEVRIKKEIAAKETELKELAPKVAEVQELMQKEKAIADKINIIKKLSNPKYARIKFFDEINRLLPEYTWLTAIAEDNVDSLGYIGFLVHGVTTSNFAVSNFMQKLESSQYFTDVKLSYTQRNEIAGTETTEFEIKVKFVEDKTKSPSKEEKPVKGKNNEEKTDIKEDK